MAERVDAGRDKLAAMREQEARARKRKLALALIGALLAVVLVVVGVMAFLSRDDDKKKVAEPAASSSGKAASYVEAMQKVPSSVYDAVGPGVAGAPITLKGAKATTGSTAKIVYFGGEYCPFCGMQRWAIVSALSRFGTWKGLTATTSSESAIPTVTFKGASYSSPYVTFTPYEIKDQEGNPLMKPSAADEALFRKYDTSEYFSAMDPGTSGSIPFMLFGTDKASAGSLFDASAMSGASGDDIAKKLTDANDATTQGIIGAANIISANICAQNGGKPAAVCNSAGVKAAAAVK